MQSNVHANFEKLDAFLSKWCCDLNKLGLPQQSLNAVYKLCGNLINELGQISENLVSRDDPSYAKYLIKLAADHAHTKISSFDSTYKYEKQLNENPLYVKPQAKAVGTRYEMQRDKLTNVAVPRLIQSSMQYISLIDTLKALFTRNDFREAFFEHNREKCSVKHAGRFVDFCCGELYKKCELYQNNRYTIQIQIAYDDFEPCNALSSKANMHKICGVYFSVKNMPPKYLSQLKNIFVLCLCNADDLKTANTDFNDIWSLVVKEVKFLEEIGIELSDKTVIKGSISFLTCDNLGFHIAMGLAQSFNCSYNCRICTCTKEEGQQMIKEDLAKLRTREQYAKQIEVIKNSTKVDYKESVGVRYFCQLNELKYFHIFENLSLDLMHDIPEGTMKYALKGFFEILIDKKVFSEDDLVKICQYYDYGKLNSANIPSNLMLKSSNLNQNASQMSLSEFAIHFERISK